MLLKFIKEIYSFFFQLIMETKEISSFFFQFAIGIDEHQTIHQSLYGKKYSDLAPGWISVESCPPLIKVDDTECIVRFNDHSEGVIKICDKKTPEEMGVTHWLNE